MKPAVPKVPKEVGAERYGGRLKQPKLLLLPYLKEEGERGMSKKNRVNKKEKKRVQEKNKIMMKDDIMCHDGLKIERQSMQN